MVAKTHVVEFEEVPHKQSLNPISCSQLFKHGAAYDRSGLKTVLKVSEIHVHIHILEYCKNFN